MNWFIAALITIPLLSLSWLTLKKAQQNNIPHTYSLGLYFLVMAVALVGWHVFSNTPFIRPSLVEVGLLLLAAIVSASANLLVMYSFEHSPNPGVSLALLATQSVWLTFASVLIFGSDIKMLSIAGVVLVAAGIASLHLKRGKTSVRWILFGLAAGVLSACVWLSTKGVQILTPDYHPATLLLYVIAPQLLIYLALGACKRHRMVFSRKNVALLLGAGVLGTLSNVALFTAVLGAPNPGYAQAVTSSNVLLTLVLAPLLSNSTLTWRQAIATFVIIAGVVLVKLAA